jgi:hypothetical protein
MNHNTLSPQVTRVVSWVVYSLALLDTHDLTVGGLKLRWWTDSRHKEELSIDETWTMITDFDGA